MTGPTLIEALRAIQQVRDRERTLSLMGSQGRPYIITVPGWLEDRYNALGTTAQEQADILFRHHVKIEVVR